MLRGGREEEEANGCIDSTLYTYTSCVAVAAAVARLIKIMTLRSFDQHSFQDAFRLGYQGVNVTCFAKVKGRFRYIM